MAEETFKASDFQAEGGGPVDEPRKVQQGFTSQDYANEEKAAIVEAANVDDKNDKKKK